MQITRPGGGSGSGLTPEQLADLTTDEELAAAIAGVGLTAAWKGDFHPEDPYPKGSLIAFTVEGRASLFLAIDDYDPADGEDGFDAFAPVITAATPDSVDAVGEQVAALVAKATARGTLAIAGAASSGAVNADQDLGTSFLLRSITATQPCRVRLYKSEPARAADAARAGSDL